MPLTQKLQTNFSKGEVSDFIGSRPDVATYFNAVSIAENFNIYPEGGAYRSPGTAFKFPAKYPHLKSRPITFEYNVEQRYLLEVGHGYTRVHDEFGGLLIELSTPWLEGDLFDLQYRQSADVLFVNHPNYQQRQINRLSHAEWTVTLFQPFIPPTFEADTDISQGTNTLTPGATSGQNVTFTVPGTIFYLSDVARQIKYRNSRAIISSVGGGGSTVVAHIISDFPNTNPIPAGQWFLIGSPATTLNPAHKGPVGKETTLVAGQQAFRDADNSKYIQIYDGIVKIYSVNMDTVTITGIIMKELSGWTSTTTPDDPEAAPAGSWTMEEASWSDTYGWPRAIEFHQQRLAQAGTRQHPTTFWLSATDDYPNYGRGIEHDDAVDYPMAQRRVNIIRWLISLGHLFIGDAQSENDAKAPGVDTPLGGDVVPFIGNPSDIGSVAIQPTVIQDALIFLDRFHRKVWELSYSWERDSFAPKDRTLYTRHLSETGFQHCEAPYAQAPDSLIYFLLSNGQLACLTYVKDEEVLAWSRIATDGFIEGVTVLPTDSGSEVWLAVWRIINGQNVRYYEKLDPATNTQSAVTGFLAMGFPAITGLSHLEGKTVDVKIAGGFIGQYPVVSGTVHLNQTWTTDQFYEVGLHYTSTLRLLRPAAQGQPTEGRLRNWQQVAVRVKNARGGKINGQPLTPLKGQEFHTGVLFANPTGSDYDGYLTITQDQPYPMTVLGISGTVSFADNIG